MESRIDRKQFFLALLILLVLLVLLAGMAFATWKALIGLSPQVATAIVAGVVTVMVSLFSVLWSKRVERIREIEQEQRKQKIPVYEEFLSLIFRMMFAEKLGEPPVTEQDMMRTIRTFAQKLMIWGSDDVLKQYSSWRRLSTTLAKENPALHLFLMENLLLAIRRDVGHKNKNFKEGDLLSIFTNDLDSYLESQKHSQ